VPGRFHRNPKLQFAFGGTRLVEGRGFGMRTAVTRMEYDEHLEFDSRKAQRHLKQLAELGLLRKVGASSSTRYEVLKP
jgi:predicted HTH transcriptional regulator